jgi:hypothetical protein
MHRQQGLRADREGTVKAGPNERAITGPAVVSLTRNGLLALIFIVASIVLIGLFIARLITKPIGRSMKTLGGLLQ